MTLQELQDQKKYVRVIASTFDKHLESIEMIGSECEVKDERYDEKIILIYNKDKTDFWWFNKSDVSELTPVEFQGKKIAIGDEVQCGDTWYTIYDCYWSDGEWVLKALSNDGNLDNQCYTLGVRQIRNHRTNQDTYLEEQKCIDFLKSKGRIKNGLIIE